MGNEFSFKCPNKCLTKIDNMNKILITSNPINLSPLKYPKGWEFTVEIGYIKD